MDHLSKQQIILLALLVSFVTSLSTGIVTVSLMDQAPAGFVQTVNQVVERTIEKAVSNEASVGELNQDSGDRIASATRIVLPSVVKIRSAGSNEALGLGIVITNSGIILTDKSIASTSSEYEVLLSDGQKFPVKVIQSQVDGNIAFLAPTVSISPFSSRIVSVTIATSTVLGQEVFTIAGLKEATLGHGILTSLDEDTHVVFTSVPVSKTSTGSPLFNPKGEAIGFRMDTLPTDEGSSFYLLESLRGVIPDF